MQYMSSPAPAPLAGIKAKRLGREFTAAIGLTLLAVSSLASADSWSTRIAQTAFGFVASAQAQTSQRIVAVGGVVTEVLYALGLQDSIVGVDTTSLWPPEAMKEKKNVKVIRNGSSTYSTQNWLDTTRRNRI